MFDNVQGAVCFKQRIIGVDRKPSIAEKRPWTKKQINHLLNSFKNQNQIFLEGHDSYSSNLLHFEIASLKVDHFLLPNEL